MELDSSIFDCLLKHSHTHPCSTVPSHGVLALYDIIFSNALNFMVHSGSYENLEHLGDAILQFLVSDYLYHRFPTLHEGHFTVSLHFLMLDL